MDHDGANKLLVLLDCQGYSCGTKDILRTMNVFIAGAFTARGRLREHRQVIRDLGHVCTCSWMDELKETWPDFEDSARQAIRDMIEIKACDCFILDTIDPSTFGNSYTEFGFSLGRMHPRYVVGPFRNHYQLLCTRRFEGWEQFHEFFHAGISERGHAGTG